MLLPLYSNFKLTPSQHQKKFTIVSYRFQYHYLSTNCFPIVKNKDLPKNDRLAPSLFFNLAPFVINGAFLFFLISCQSCFCAYSNSFSFGISKKIFTSAANARFLTYNAKFGNCANISFSIS